MNQINRRVQEIGIPERMRSRPVASNGFPVPWFVTVKDAQGEWEFRAVHRERYVEAHKKQLCWVCGQPLGRYRTFAIGPMCAVNRVTSEPPTHRECAEWSVKVCPFLSQPRMRRNEVDLPEGAGEGTPGIMLQRNPGVTMLWYTERGAYEIMKVDKKGGFLFKLKTDPLESSWWRAGVPAERGHVMESVESGLPKLVEMAKLDGPEAVIDLNKQIARAHEKFFDRIPELGVVSDRVSV